MRKQLFTGLFLLACLALNAQVIKKEDINKDNLYNFGGSMTEYIAPDVTYSKAPKGFKPFYLSHYGRHGSRYLLNDPQYTGPYNTLKEAADKGVLTPFGKTVLDRLEKMKDDAAGKLGDLTKKGQRQHRGIARRMVENYPEIFNKKSVIVAKSTTSHRVMNSMTSALMEFSALLPKMEIDYAVSSEDAGYLNSEDRAVNSAKNNREKSAAVSEFNARHTHPERLMTALFTDTTFITRYVKPNSTSAPRDNSASLYNQIYEVAANMGSHDLGFDLDDVFTYEEWYDNFLQNNMYWYTQSAWNPITENIIPYGHATLLQDFLDKADEAIAKGTPSANLRYGHDTALFPLLCLMKVNDCGWDPADLEQVADKWVAYRIVHMGSNLQLIFYKHRKTILVRALLNEEEATLPVECYKDNKGVEYPYFYEWNKVEKYYRDVLNEWTRIKETIPAGTTSSSTGGFRMTR